MRCEHIKLPIENPNTIDIDRIFHSYVIVHNKKFHYYLMKCQYKLVFKGYQYCSHIASEVADKETMFSWSNFFKM